MFKSAHESNVDPESKRLTESSKQREKLIKSHMSSNQLIKSSNVNDTSEIDGQQK